MGRILLRPVIFLVAWIGLFFIGLVVFIMLRRKNNSDRRSKEISKAEVKRKDMFLEFYRSLKK